MAGSPARENTATASGSQSNVARLEKQVALLQDKLANAEDEFAALYAKSLKNDAKEQERVSRHHKAVHQLQKKVLAEAEIRRQLQRKLDDKDAPLSAALSEKEVAWAAERERLSAQVLALEQQRAGLQEELARGRVQLQQCEASLKNWSTDKQAMSASLNELEASVAHWKSTAEKRKMQASDAVAAQRSSDSRVVVLDAELKRLRNEHTQKNCTDVMTQTEPTSEREEVCAQRLAWEMTQEMAICLRCIGQLGDSLRDNKAFRAVVPSMDASIGTEPLRVSNVSIATDPAPPAKNVEVQTRHADSSTKVEAGMQTMAEARATRYHVDTQTHSPLDLAETPDVGTSPGTPPSSQCSYTGINSTDAALGEAEVSNATNKVLQMWPKPESCVIKKDIETRDERWWRRSPLKAADPVVSPNGSPATPGPSTDGVRAFALRMDVSSLDRLAFHGSQGVDSSLGGPVSPTATAMGSGTPHPKPTVRRHFVGATPSANARSSPAAGIQMTWPLSLAGPLAGHAAHGSGIPTPSSGVMREGALKRPLFRPSEPPLQVRLPNSPLPSPPVAHQPSQTEHSPGAAEHGQLSAEQADEAHLSMLAAICPSDGAAAPPTTVLCDPDAPADASLTKATGEDCIAADVAIVEHLDSQQSQKTTREVPKSIGCSAYTPAVQSGAGNEESVQHRLHGDSLDSAPFEPSSTAPSLENDGSSSSERDAPEAQIPGQESADSAHSQAISDVEQGGGDKFDGTHVQQEQARVQSSIAEHHSIEAALLAGRTDRILLSHKPTASAPAHAEEVPGGCAATPGHHPPVPTMTRGSGSEAVPARPAAGAPAPQQASETADSEEAELENEKPQPARKKADGQVDVIDHLSDEDHLHGIQNTGPPEPAKALGAPFVSHTHHHHIRLIAEEGPRDLSLPDVRQGADSACQDLSSPSPSALCLIAGCDAAEERKSGAQSQPPLNPKFAFGSPRDAVSLLTGSWRVSQEASSASENVVVGAEQLRQGHAKGVNSPESDSSDDETWNGFVARGLRPRLEKSLLDEAAGLNKTLASSLTKMTTSHSRGLRHMDSDRTDLFAGRNAGTQSRQNVRAADGFRGRGLDAPAQAAEPQVLNSSDALNELNGLLDEVRRATDRCERRKRMMNILDDADHLLSEERDDLACQREGQLGRLAAPNAMNQDRQGLVQDKPGWIHNDSVRPHRRKGLLNRKFGGERHKGRSTATSELGGEKWSVRASSRPWPRAKVPLSGQGPVSISPGRNELLQMLFGPDESESAIRWSPIKPSQMAMLRSFLSAETPPAT